MSSIPYQTADGSSPYLKTEAIPAYLNSFTGAHYANTEAVAASNARSPTSPKSPLERLDLMVQSRNVIAGLQGELVRLHGQASAPAYSQSTGHPESFVGRHPYPTERDQQLLVLVENLRAELVRKEQDMRDQVDEHQLVALSAGLNETRCQDLEGQLAQRDVAVAEIKGKVDDLSRTLLGKEEEVRRLREESKAKNTDLEAFLREKEAALHQREVELAARVEEGNHKQLHIDKLEHEAKSHRHQAGEGEALIRHLQQELEQSKASAMKLEEDHAVAVDKATKQAEIDRRKVAGLEDEVAKARRLFSEMSAAKHLFQSDLEDELNEGREEIERMRLVVQEANIACATAESRAKAKAEEAEAAQQELSGLRETLMSRLSDAAHKAAQMIEEVEESAARRIAEIEEQLNARMEDMDLMDEQHAHLLALRPTPASQFTVKKLLKQVKAMEKEVTALRSSVSERKIGSDTEPEGSDDTEDEEKPKKTKKTTTKKVTRPSKLATSRPPTPGSGRSTPRSAKASGKANASPGSRLAR